jgi:hypothetical protein
MLLLMNELSQLSFHPSTLAYQTTASNSNNFNRRGETSYSCTLESQSTIRGVSTELAIQAGQNKVAAEVPKVYDRFAKLFQQRSIVTIPAIKTMGSCNRLQTNGPRCTPLQNLPHDTR